MDDERKASVSRAELIKSIPRCPNCGSLIGKNAASHICKPVWNKGTKGIHGGWKLSDETKKRMAQNNSRYWKGKKGTRLGKKHSEEAIAKMRKPKSEAHKANLRKPKNAEWVANWRAARIRNGSFANSKQQRERHSVLMTGAANPNWKGGLSFIPYPPSWTPALRRGIRDRDGHVCQVCGTTKNSRSLEVHHIDYDKNNCDPSNLIALCISCHRKTNFDRSTWESLLKAKVNEIINRNSNVPSSGQAA